MFHLDMKTQGFPHNGIILGHIGSGALVLVLIKQYSHTYTVYLTINKSSSTGCSLTNQSVFQKGFKY